MKEGFRHQSIKQAIKEPCKGVFRVEPGSKLDQELKDKRGPLMFKRRKRGPLELWDTVYQISLSDPKPGSGLSFQFAWPPVTRKDYVEYNADALRAPHKPQS